jgi:glutaredoxin
MKNSLSASEAATKQQCTLTKLRLTLAALSILYLTGLGFYADRHNWPAFFLWLVLLPCTRWLGMRLYPLTSKWRGYGSVADKLPTGITKNQAEVTFYSHSGCPFCPILKRRLEVLQKQMDFTLEEIDLTLSPQMAASRGIKSVPVVEVRSNRLFGNATTDQLAQLIEGTKPADTFLPA